MTDTCVSTHLKTCPLSSLHPEFPGEPSTRGLPLTAAGKSELVWEMKMLLQGKETGQMSGATQSNPRAPSYKACASRGRRGKKGNFQGEQRRISRESGRHPGKRARAPKGQQVEQEVLNNSLSERMGDFTH